MDEKNDWDVIWGLFRMLHDLLGMKYVMRFPQKEYVRYLYKYTDGTWAEQIKQWLNQRGL